MKAFRVALTVSQQTLIYVEADCEQEATDKAINGLGEACTPYPPEIVATKVRELGEDLK